MTEEQIHNIYLHMSGKAEGIAEISGSADFPVLFARAVMEFNRKEWQGLTDEDRQEIERWIEFKEAGGNEPVPTQKIITYVEAKLKEKNSA